MDAQAGLAAAAQNHGGRRTESARILLSLALDASTSSRGRSAGKKVKQLFSNEVTDCYIRY